MLKNIINSHCAYNIKETHVCVWADLLPHHHNFSTYFPHLFGPKLSYHKKKSETVYSLNGFWNRLAWKRQKKTAFYSPWKEDNCLQLYRHCRTWESSSSNLLLKKPGRTTMGWATFVLQFSTFKSRLWNIWIHETFPSVDVDALHKCHVCPLLRWIFFLISRWRGWRKVTLPWIWQPGWSCLRARCVSYILPCCSLHAI